jgi:hypothetical protein
VSSSWVYHKRCAVAFAFATERYRSAFGLCRLGPQLSGACSLKIFCRTYSRQLDITASLPLRVASCALVARPALCVWAAQPVKTPQQPCDAFEGAKLTDIIYEARTSRGGSAKCYQWRPDTLCSKVPSGLGMPAGQQAIPLERLHDHASHSQQRVQHRLSETRMRKCSYLFALVVYVLCPNLLAIKHCPHVHEPCWTVHAYRIADDPGRIQVQLHVLVLLEAWLSTEQG